MERFITVVVITAGALWAALLLSAFFGKLFSTVYDHYRKPGREWKSVTQEADAIILKVEHTDRLIYNRSALKLQMQVKPLHGRNFVAELICKNTNEGIREGAMVRVKYNPKNAREILIIES